MPSVRRAVPGDADRLAQIRVDAWRATYAGLVAPDVLAGLSVDEARSRWARRLIDPALDVLVATDSRAPGSSARVEAEAVVGYAVVGRDRDAAPDDTDIGEVHAVYVDPPAWRGGAGTALLRAAERRLVDRGAIRAHLWVLTDNHRARAFYERRRWAADSSRVLGSLLDPAGRAVRETRYSRALQDLRDA